MRLDIDEQFIGRALLLLAFAVVAPTGLLAQQAATEATTDVDLARGAAQADGTGTSAIKNPAPTVTLESGGKDGSFLSAHMGLTTHYERNNFQFDLKAKAPLNPGDTEKAFLNLDGLTGSSAGTATITYEHLGSALGHRCEKSSQGPFDRLCAIANAKTIETLEKKRGKLPAGTCSAADLAQDPYWQNIAEQRRQAALWVLCEEINKQRPTGWLAPSGVEINGGYAATCSVEELAKARQEALQKQFATKAMSDIFASGVDWTNLPDPERNKLKDAGIKKATAAACEDFSKAHEKKLLDASCSVENLVKESLPEEVTKKTSEALVKLCQEAQVVPAASLYSTDKNSLTPCLFSNLWTAATDGKLKGVSYRQILSALPVTLYYVVFESTLVDQSFKYLDPANGFAKVTRDGDGKSYSLSASLFSHGWLAGISVARLTEFQGSPATQVCLPIPGTTALACKNTALAAPTEARTDVYRAELKTWLTQSLGFTARSNYDKTNKAWEHHILLQFLRDPKAGVNGGLDLQYNTKVKEDATHFQARVFVGTTFDLPFPKKAS